MKHITVLLNETIDYLNIKKDGIYVDATLGGGGHSKLILENLDKGHLYAFDQDLFAIGKAEEYLSEYSNKTIIHDNFANVKARLNAIGIDKIDGIIMDLGMSSFQIDDELRGFSYLANAKLDMRMNQQQDLTAADIVNNYSKEDLVNILFKYGDEQNSFKIADEIIKTRPINYTNELVAICDKVNFKRRGHSAKKVFQALRIEVNQELKALETLLEDLIDLLNKDGIIAAITFHSLEDRIVKHFFKDKSEVRLPKGLPIIDLPEMPLKVITRKPVYPTDSEINENSRSKSAKLRVAMRN